MRASIVGASGYTGGELLRLLLGHPHVTLQQITARRAVGRFAHQVHPHLRGRTDLRFSPVEALEPCDLLFLALPHGESTRAIDQYANLAPRIIDLSGDFRTSSLKAPHWAARFVYGLPEINREALRDAQYVSGVGCNATAVILALAAVADLVRDTPIADVKVGSSEAGHTPSEASHHAARSGVVRPFKLTGHRHEAEVRQALGCEARIAVTSVGMVRGAAAAVHTLLPPSLAEKDLWRAYRERWQGEPFVRIVHERTGIHRHPEPRLLAGTNYADLGWEYDPETGRAALLCAIDNLGKGAAGSAVQSMNVMLGYEETTALEFGGIYP